MDSYEILGIERDSSDKEIEVAFLDLKNKYDPSKNTSKYAYKKYREILKAYEDVKDDLRRKMYNLKDDEVSEERKEESYELYNFSEEKKEIIIDKEDIKEVEVNKEDLVINVECSYLKYLLNLKEEITYKRRINCKEKTNEEICTFCNGLGIVEHNHQYVYCPSCHGKKVVSINCLKCGDLGYVYEENKLSFVVSDKQIIFENKGNEYYKENSNLIINLEFNDINNIKVNGNKIDIDYYLNNEEAMNGINKIYKGVSSDLEIKVNDFNITKNLIVNYEDKTLNFNFITPIIDGKDIIRYLVINNKNKEVYFNSDYSKVSLLNNEVYFNKVLLDKEIIIDNQGEDGYFGGKKGNLIIKVMESKKNELNYLSNVKEIETSKSFNLLGGKINDLYHFGFKGSNSFITRNNKIYLLTGNKEVRNKLSYYFLFKVVSILLWILIPLLSILLTYNKEMYYTLFITLSIYLILINLVMEVKV